MTISEFISLGICVNATSDALAARRAMAPNPQIRQSLELQFEKLRNRLVAIATSIAGADIAQDVVQEAFLKLWRTPGHEAPHDGYVLRTVRTTALDVLRKRSRQSKAAVQASSETPVVGEEEELTIRPEEILSDAFADLSQTERAVLQLRVDRQLPYCEIMDRLALTYTAARKHLQRALLKVRSRIAFRMLMEGRIDELGGFRLRQSHAVQVARWCRSERASLEYLFGVLRRKDLNKAVKNATLILTPLLPRGWEPTNEVERQLTRQLEYGDLFRGQKMYIAESLLDRRYRQQIYRVARVFLSQLEQLEDRPARRLLIPAEMAATNPTDIFDVKHVRPIGGEVRESIVRTLGHRYESGQGSPDLRRCIAFQLQRTHVTDPEPLRSLINGLHQEHDQMNAVYSAKFIRKQGINRHPFLAREACHAIKAVAGRWPQNIFLATAFDQLALRLSGAG